jgi:hypothetical protein
LRKRYSYLGLNRVNVFYLTWRISLVLFLVAQSGCFANFAVEDDSEYLSRIGEIKKRLAAARGLKFTDDVPIIVKKKNEMLRYLEGNVQEDYGDEKLKDITLAYQKLGLLPPGTDLKNSLLNFYNAQIVSGVSGGRIPGDGIRRPAEGHLDEMALVHELTHLLQDQHFSVRDRFGPSNNDDKTLAFRSIVEGDALLTEFAYRFGGINRWSRAQINRALENSSAELAPIFADIPTAIGDKFLFQYQDGGSFVYRLHEERGWPGINLLYRSPPLSTEQVLHPEKYSDLPDPPMRVRLKNLSSLFPPEWREIENNTLGELMVRCLFKEFFSTDEAIKVSNGWDGDRFVAFRQESEVSFIWASVWDSSKDAEEFARKFQEILSRKYSSSHSRSYMERRGNLVVIVEGLEQTHVEKRINKILQEINLEEEPFKLPFALPSVS